MRFPFLLLLLVIFRPTPVWPQSGATAPDDFLTRMQSLIQSGHAEQAVSDLKRETEKNPRDAYVLNLLGLAYTASGKLAEGDGAFRQALRVDPRLSASLRNLAINENTLGEHTSSIAHFNQLLRSKPDDPVAHVYLGTEAFVQHDYAKARSLLQKVGPFSDDSTVRMEMAVADLILIGPSVSDPTPKMSTPLSTRGISPDLVLSGAIALAQHGDNAQAAQLFALLPAEMHSQAFVLYDHALSLLRSNQADHASELLSNYLIQHVHTGPFLDLAAEAYLEATPPQAQKAIDSLREAIKLEPLVEDHYISLAEICSRFNANDVGIEVLDAGLHALPNSDRLFFERGVLEALNQQPGQADTDFRRAASLAPQKSLAQLALGVSLMQAGKLPEAIRELRSRTAVDSNNAVLYYMLAVALLQNGATPGKAEYAEAQKSLQTAIALDSQYEPPLVELARISVEEGQLGQAHSLLERAVSIAPQDSAAFNQLAIVDHRLGLKVEAEQAIQKLKEINEKQRNDTHRLKISAGPSKPVVLSGTQ